MLDDKKDLDPDPGDPKTYRSYGSGSATLLPIYVLCVAGCHPSDAAPARPLPAQHIRQAEEIPDTRHDVRTSLGIVHTSANKLS